MVDIHTVSAGGGSIAWVDSGGALRVGPQSAGADPGRPATAAAASEPTVTDANLVLGRLPAESPIAAGLRLDVGAARAALEALGIGRAEEAAEGVVEVAVNAMVQALRVVSVERGHDPAGAALIAFGGAGPLHACELADAARRHARAVPAGQRRAVGGRARRRRAPPRRLAQPAAPAGRRRRPRRGGRPSWPAPRDGEERARRGRPALRRPVVRAADPVRGPGRARRRLPRRARAPLRPRRSASAPSSSSRCAPPPSARAPRSARRPPGTSSARAARSAGTARTSRPRC